MEMLKRVSMAGESPETWAVLCDLSSANIPAIEQQMESLFASARGDIALDLRDVAILDSRGVGLLLLLAKRAWNRGAKLILRHPAPNVLSVLELTSMDRLAVLETDG